MATPVILPKQGNSVESVIIQQWHKKPGEVVAEGDVLCEVETDKAVMEVPAPASGTLLEVFFADDDEVAVLTTIAAIGDAGEDVSDLRPEDPDAATAPASPADDTVGGSADTAAVEPPRARSTPEVASTDSGDGGSSPRGRSAATKAGVEVTTVPGSGPGGRVIERDVIAAAGDRRLTPAARDALAGGGLAAPARGGGPGGRIRAADLGPAAGASEEIPVRGVRKVIAERMRASLADTAQLTLHAVAEVTALQTFRAHQKAHGETLGVAKLSINDLVCHAVARTLPRFPECNAHFLGEKIVRHGAVHLGVAVDTPRGLMVPVVRDADRRAPADLAAEIRRLATACQEGAAAPEDLRGGTFTLTNLGAAGVEHFTPVLNPPEVAILGVGGIATRPQRRADGGVDFVDVIHLSLTIDHQAIDGAPAARFLEALGAAIANFDLLLAGEHLR